MVCIAREIRRKLSIGLVLVATLSFLAVGKTAQSSDATAEPIRARLIASTTTVTPGVPITLGVFFKIEPGWHLYWKFAGDAGLPPTIKWNLPAGWTVGSVQWPLPVRFTEKGPLTTYGYSDSLLLAVEVTPPANTPATGEVSLTAKAKWLVCHDECIPGGADLSIVLPVSIKGPTLQVRDGERQFAKWRTQLPVEKTPTGFTANTRLGALDSTGRKLTLTLSARSTDRQFVPTDWFPAPTSDFTVKNIQIIRRVDGLEITCEIHSFRKPLSEIGTLESLIISADSSRERRGVSIFSSLSSKS